MTTLRQNKVSEMIRQELADIFQKEMRNAFGPGLITVTHVFVSPDLSFAKTYLSIFGAPNKEATLENIRSQAREIRHQLGLRTRKHLRIVPEVAFFPDDSAEYADKIDQLFIKIAADQAAQQEPVAKKRIRKTSKPTKRGTRKAK